MGGKGGKGNACVCVRAFFSVRFALSDLNGVGGGLMVHESEGAGAGAVVYYIVFHFISFHFILFDRMLSVYLSTTITGLEFRAEHSAVRFFFCQVRLFEVGGVGMRVCFSQGMIGVVLGNRVGE